MMATFLCLLAVVIVYLAGAFTFPISWRRAVIKGASRLKTHLSSSRGHQQRRKRAKVAEVVSPEAAGAADISDMAEVLRRNGYIVFQKKPRKKTL